MDIYLKSKSKSEIDPLLALLEEDGRRIIVDRIGTIWVPSGELDGDGDDIPKPIDGYHVNARIVSRLPVETAEEESRWFTDEQEQAIQPFLVDPPSNPKRKWA